MFGLTVLGDIFENFTIIVYMKNFYYKIFLKYLIYYMNEMFYELLCVVVVLYLKNLFLKKWSIQTDDF